MDFRGLDLNLLVILDALFTERSVTRGGERVRLSQSATSTALSRLRDYFQDELLVQVGHRMVLTPHAEGLVEPVRDLLLRAESITKHNTNFDPATAVRTFRLRMSDYAATVLLPGFVPALRKLAPGVTLDIQSNLHMPVESLERGEIDLLIMPQQFMSKSHPSEVLFEDGYVCVVWSENKLVKNRISLAQYLAMGHAAVKFSDMASPVLEDWFASQFGQRRRIEVISMAFTLLPQLVAGTDLIATMHERLARKYAKLFPLRLIPPPMQIPTLTECVQWHKYHDFDPGILWLRRLLAQSVAEPPKRSRA